MRKTYLLATLCLLFMGVMVASAQRYFVTNQYVYDLFLVNPAATAMRTDCYSFNAYIQKQWWGTELAPSTQILTFQRAYKSNLGIGSYIYNDRNGNHHEVGAQQTFAYKVRLVKKRRKNVSLLFGMSLFADYRYLDMSNFNSSASMDPVMGGGAKTSGFSINSNAGAILIYNKWQFGLSATNMVPFTNTLYTMDEEPKVHMDMNLYLSTYYKLPNYDLYLEPSVFYRRNNYLDSRTDFNLRATMPTKSSDLVLWGLGSYRRSTDESWGENLGAAVTLGVFYKSVMVGMEYQFTLTDARQNYGNSYQLLLGYRFCRDRKREALPCIDDPKRRKTGFAVKK